MDIARKIERSHCTDKIDYSKIYCRNNSDKLVAISDTKTILVEPIWLRDDDVEGSFYRKYRLAHPSYQSIYLRLELWKRLQVASAKLPNNRKLIVRAGHRPVDVQNQVLNAVMEDYKIQHTEASSEEALNHARIYVSDPSIKLPPHCCGSAIDVDVLDVSKQSLVDFGTPVNEDSDVSHIYSPKITKVQAKNRHILLKSMLEAGFASYYAEWWHFSYGDQIWAWFYGHNSCLYGVVSA
jgi:D-alanyl-D-alanine dipeptidase